MKFDYIIGNPPYQEDVGKEAPRSNGQTRKKSVFQYFQTGVEKLANKSVVLIYPGGRWIHRSGKGMEEFGLKQINDPHLRRIVFYPDSSDLFSGVDVADGLSIVIKDMRKKTNEFQYEYITKDENIEITIKSPGDNLLPLNPKDMSIVEKVEKLVAKLNLKYLFDRILSQKLFGIESNFVEDNPDKAIPLEGVNSIDYSKKVKLLTNDKAGPAGRAKWFVVDRDLIPASWEYIDEWQVIVSSAHGGGHQNRDNQLEIVDNHSAFGRARVALASFKTEEEARNFYKYAESNFVKFMLLMTDEALTSLGKRVPDLGNYKADNPLVKFGEDIDDQLKQLTQMTDEEYAHLTTTVKKAQKRYES